MVDKTTTIRINKTTKELMNRVKIHHRETYDDLIKRKISVNKKIILQHHKGSGIKN